MTAFSSCQGNIPFLKHTISIILVMESVCKGQAAHITTVGAGSTMRYGETLSARPREKKSSYGVWRCVSVAVSQVSSNKHLALVLINSAILYEIPDSTAIYYSIYV